MSERTVEKAIREEFFRHLPRRSDIAAAKPINVVIDVAPAIVSERDRLQAALDSGDLATIIGKYPIRETPALNTIASELGFQDREQYESAVRKLLMDDHESLIFLRAFFGSLAADIDRG